MAQDIILENPMILGYSKASILQAALYFKYKNEEDPYQTLCQVGNIVDLLENPEISKLFSDDDISELFCPAREIQNSETDEPLFTDTEWVKLEDDQFNAMIPIQGEYYALCNNTAEDYSFNTLSTEYGNWYDTIIPEHYSEDEGTMVIGDTAGFVAIE